MTKCIVDLGGIEGISEAAINDCYAVYLRLWSQEDKVMIYRTDDDLDIAVALSGTLPIFTELKEPYSDKWKASIIKNGMFMHIASEDKEIIHELYISSPSLTLGLIEPPYRCLEITEHDFFISYVILNYTSTNRARVFSWREKHPDVTIYIRGITTEQQTQHALAWKVDGIITNCSKLVTEYIQTFSCAKFD